MKQGEDNQKQNVTLLVFTVVTVIFVRPLIRCQPVGPHPSQTSRVLSQLTMWPGLPVANVIHIERLWDEQQRNRGNRCPDDLGRTVQMDV